MTIEARIPLTTVRTREDDVHGGYYRPAYLHRARIGLGADGLLVAWRHTVVGQSILVGTPFEPFLVKNGIDATSVEGVSDAPYLKDIPSHRVDLHSPKTGIPVLWWRSVGHSHTAFVVESLIDELAQAAGKDPVEYRRALLKNHRRSEEHTSELQSHSDLVCRLLLEKKKKKKNTTIDSTNKTSVS